MPVSEMSVANVDVVPVVEIITWLNGPVTVPLAPAKRPVPPVNVLVAVPVALPEASSVPLPVKVANSWSPFAATVTNEPATVKVLGPVGVSVASKWVVVVPRCDRVPVVSLTKVSVPRSRCAWPAC